MKIRNRLGLGALCAMMVGLAACDASPMGPSITEPALAPASLVIDECVVKNGVWLCSPTGTTQTDSTATTNSVKAPVEECVIKNGVWLCPSGGRSQQ